MHIQFKFIAAVAAVALTFESSWAEDAKVAEVQQKLQQARAAEAAAKAKYEEARKASAALNPDRQKLASLKKEVDAALVTNTSNLSPDQVRAHTAKTDQLQSQLATAQREFKQKSDPVMRAEKDARFAASQAAGTTKAIEAELAKAQSKSASTTSSKSGEKTAAAPAPSPSVAAAAAAATDEVNVPDISAFDGLAEMKAVARHAGLVPALVATKATPPPGSTRLFADQDPKPGKKAKKGDPLKILVYQKPAGTVDMPNLTGLTLDQATIRLKGNMTITSDEIGDKPPTPEQALTIFSQHPAPNAMVKADEPIVVTVKRYGSAKSDEPVTEESPASETTVTGTTSTNPEETLFQGKGKSKNAATATKTTSKSAAPKKKKALTDAEKKARARAWFRSQGHD